MTSQSPHVNLNLNVRGMANSATVAINERSNELLRAGKQVFKLGLGQSPFPVPEPVVEALRQNAFQKDYLPVRGLWELREAVAAYHRRADGLERTGADVLIGPGSKELMFLLQLVYYGDLVIPTPAWVSYAPQAQIIGRKVQLIRTRSEDGWHLLPEGLDEICAADSERPRLVILNYPSNPTGGSYTVDELRGLAEVARKHRIVLLSDEIYGELHHRGEHVSIARFYPEGTIVSSGLSKWCGAGGWRLGTFLFPPDMHWMLNAMASAASETYTSTSAPIQHAAVRAFTHGAEIEAYLDASRRVLAALGGWCVDTLNAAGIQCDRPDGAFYLFPDLGSHRDALAKRGIQTSADLCRRLLDETGVAVLPGSDFGRPKRELTIRLAYVDFDGGGALDFAHHHDTLDAAFLRSHCANVVTAIERICEWAPAEAD